jgi:hypothetical protein
MNVTPTSRGPALILTRVRSLLSISSAGLRHVRVRREVVLVAAGVRQEHAFSVDGDLDLVRELETGHVADDISQQEDVEVVLAVLRKIVTDEESATRAQRKSFDVIGLLGVRRHAIDPLCERRVGADGETADLSRSRQVLLEQGRGDLQDAGDVVEAVALVVGRQQLCDVDLQIEQIANRVAIFGAIQSMDWFMARIGTANRLLVERRLETRDKAVEGGRVRTRHALRRHHAATDFANDLFPELRLSGCISGVQTLEDEDHRSSPARYGTSRSTSGRAHAEASPRRFLPAEPARWLDGTRSTCEGSRSARTLIEAVVHMTAAAAINAYVQRRIKPPGIE